MAVRVIVLRKSTKIEMVKVQIGDNEPLADDQLAPVTGMLLPLERLEQLKRVTYKPPKVKASKRIAKPRKQVQRQYRLVTQLEAQEIWRRRSEGERFTTIARALFMRVPTVFRSFHKMQRRNGMHVDLRSLNGRKTKTKITL